MIFGQLHLNLGRPCTSHNFPANQEEVTSFDVWRRRHVHVHARWKTNGCSQWFLPCSVRPGETTARRALILQSKSTVQEEKVLSSSSPSIGLCMLSLYQQTRTLWYSMLLTLLNRSNIPLSRDNWQQSVIFTSAMATSLTLGSSFACTLSAVALRDLKVAQSELVCQLQYPHLKFFYSLLAIRYTANYDSNDLGCYDVSFLWFRSVRWTDM